MSEERKPMLSDEDAATLALNGDSKYGQYVTVKSMALTIRDWYESKITKGELKVVTKVEVHHPLVPEEMWREWYSDPMRLKDDSFGMLVTKCCSQNPYFNANRQHSYFGIPPLTWGCPECGLTVKLQDDNE